MARIDLKKVNLTFTVRKDSGLTLKEFVVRGMFRKSLNPPMKVRALREVDLSIGDGGGLVRIDLDDALPLLALDVSNRSGLGETGHR